jgi:hypothetical protein
MAGLLTDFSNVGQYLSGIQFESNLILSYKKQNVVRYRNDLLVDACRNKKVLHIGCCDHVPLVKEKIKTGQWLHSQLTSVAEEAIGIDTDADAVCKVRTMSGLDNVFCGDITKKDPIAQLRAKRFDVAVFGEVVEHVGNPVHFLTEFVSNYGDNCSEIIITVPNAFRAGNIRNVFSHREVINSDHRFFFTPYTITKIAVDAKIRPLKIEMASFTEQRSIAKRAVLSAWPLLAENIVLTGALGWRG